MAEDLQTRFLRLHMAHQKALFAYLLGAVRDFGRAEDLLQQVTLVLWKKFGQYRETSPYLPWAFGVARREVAHYYRERGRRGPTLPLEVLEDVARVLEEERLPEEGSALSGCLEKLQPDQRELLRLRYEEGVSLRALAERLGQSLAAVNMKLVRIRRLLLDCTAQGRLEA